MHLKVCSISWLRSPQASFGFAVLLFLSLSLREQSPQALAKYCIIVIGPLRYCLLLIVAARRVRCFHCVLFMFFGVREKVQQNKVAHRDRHRHREREREKAKVSKGITFKLAAAACGMSATQSAVTSLLYHRLNDKPKKVSCPSTTFAKWKCVCALRTHKTREIKACNIKADRWQPCLAHFMTPRSPGLIQMSVLHCSKIQYLRLSFVFCCCWWQLYDRHGDT